MRLALLLALASLTVHAQVAPGMISDVIAPPAPAADPGRVVAQAVPQPIAAVPSVALNPLAPLVPPACTPTGKPFPVWLTVTLAIAGATVSTLEALHSTGVVGR